MTSPSKVSLACAWFIALTGWLVVLYAFVLRGAPAPIRVINLAETSDWNSCAAREVGLFFIPPPRGYREGYAFSADAPQVIRDIETRCGTLPGAEPYVDRIQVYERKMAAARDTT